MESSSFWRRHQSSLEGIINFHDPQPLPADQRHHAQRRFYKIVNNFDDGNRTSGYKRSLLVRYTYEYSRSELSKDTFLRAFFEFMEVDFVGEGDRDFDDQAQVGRKLAEFADFLLDNFYLPMKATSKNTLQPTPAHLSVVQRVQGRLHEFTGTLERLSFLRGLCLVRDRHRCVISRAFDKQEAVNRLNLHGDNAQDDEGKLLRRPFAYLEVAHILPHSLTQADANSELSDSKKAALMILNMFDCDVSHLVDGINIDRPSNAISLTHDFHRHFGNFDVYFEPVADQEHTYQIKSFLPSLALEGIPVTRTLYLADDQSIDPPLPRLLAIHNAIAHILHLSGAGEYIDKILRDMEETGVQRDGSTNLGRIVKLKLAGWLNDAVDVH
ncbi:hypothetical protein CPC735_043730 [Coccidioides posadasii C735 delta SOWgp]|uniref:HNH nuclease domain-containing protein n=1 Tax=Coccidioides posadasii (strain C735) TaxID=222929 RepID=C5PBE5_COCP7|nr:hypothetical protein CPC735_043730 [Coccidioides posadasii C735 delta SOWgp]EER25929.1 hypothetical protein CPC735_043730 [Coccidioides posadasii C735 delta SOWgp]|eukprot:XP_003068074.1 hypothetical protein CPC735_043730 [Coccidioides posadasii C735 delta SOWgp]